MSVRRLLYCNPSMLHIKRCWLTSVYKLKWSKIDVNRMTMKWNVVQLQGKKFVDHTVLRADLSATLIPSTNYSILCAIHGTLAVFWTILNNLDSLTWPAASTTDKESWRALYFCSKSWWSALTFSSSNSASLALHFRRLSSSSTLACSFVRTFSCQN